MASLQMFADSIESLRTRYHKEQGALETKRNELEERKKVLLQLERKSQVVIKASKFLQSCSEAIRQIGKKKIESVVTSALKAITGDNYEFVIEMEQSRNQWSAKFHVRNPDGLVVPLVDGCGGGIENIVGFAIQLSILEMHNPRVQVPFRLDEVFSNLSLELEDWEDRTIQFMREISEKLDRQIILSTHNTGLASIGDVGYHVENKNGKSQISKV